MTNAQFDERKTRAVFILCNVYDLLDGPDINRKLYTSTVQNILSRAAERNAAVLVVGNMPCLVHLLSNLADVTHPNLASVSLSLLFALSQWYQRS